MEMVEKEKQQSSSSYTYWVREATVDAAPMPVPRKLSTEELSQCSKSSNLGSVWNQELINSLGPMEFFNGNAAITEVSKCTGDAFLVIVRNKKCVGYSYELTLRFKGEWLIQEEKWKIKGHIDVLEFSFGELDDLQIEVMLSDDKDLTAEDKRRVVNDLKSYLPGIREKLLAFEEELKDR